MSDQPKPAEIEDVLSSIRRLVAGGGTVADSSPVPADAGGVAQTAGSPAETDAAPEAEPDADDGPETPAAAAVGLTGPDEETAPAPVAPEGDAAQPETAADGETADMPSEPALVLTQALRIGGGESDTPGAQPSSPDEAGPGADEDEAPVRMEDEAPVRMEDEASARMEDDTSTRMEDDASARLEDEGQDLEDPAAIAGREDAAAQAGTPDAEGAEAPNAGQRRSPFLPQSLSAGESGGDGAGAAPEMRRQGFGFGAVRRDDPVRHVPLRERADSGGGEGESPDPAVGEAGSDGDATALSGATADQTGRGAAPSAPHRADEDAMQEIETGLAQDSAGAEARPAPPLEPIISPDFARRSPSGAGSEDVPTEPSEGPDHACASAAEVGGIADAETGEAPPETVAQAAEPAPETPDALNEPASIVRAETDTADETDATAPRAWGEPQAEDEGPLAPDLHDGAAGAPAVEPGPDDDAATPVNLFGEDDFGMDEEALRALVAEVVQRELQGALGERVSRNIRALVRREIARALDARDLD